VSEPFDLRQWLASATPVPRGVDEPVVSPELLAPVRRLFADFDRAKRAGDVEVSSKGVAALRKRAAVLVRCKDCKAMPVAYVVLIEGRPLFWCRHQDGTSGFTWLDGEFWGNRAWCKKREYVLPADVLIEHLSSPQGRHTIGVSHSGVHGAMR
jgi:hypothetical protein